MRIITNHHYRDILSAREVPGEILKKEFDWVESPEVPFIKYKGEYYCLLDFQPTSFFGSFQEFDAVFGLSYYSGIAIKRNKEGDKVKVAYFYQ